MQITRKVITMGILMQFWKQKERIIQSEKILSIIHVLFVMEIQEKDRWKTGFQEGYFSTVKTKLDREWLGGEKTNAIRRDALFLKV